MDEHRSALGRALLSRSDDVAAAVLERVWPGGGDSRDDDVRAAVAAADRLATQLIGHWLESGRQADERQRRRLASLGGMIGRVGLDDLVKAYLAWRDTVLAVLDEEAARLGTPAELVGEVQMVVSRGSDGSIVRMARRFEEQRRVLQVELEAERAKLAEEAFRDGLTGLPNRALLFDRIEQALRAASRGERAVAVLFVDLDGFKRVNDQLGHEAGDRLLVDVAVRLRRVMRDADTVARFGGDEFVVLCDGVEDPAVPRRVAARIVDVLARPFALDEGAVSISASVGIAVAGADAGARELLRQADVAMYRAKERGPGRYQQAEPAPVTTRAAASR